MAPRSRERRLRRVIDDARALGEEGRAREAVALLREESARHPRDAELRLALAGDDPLVLFRVASALRGADARAEPLLRAAFDAAPGARAHAQWLAGLLIDHDRLDEALDVVQRGLDHRPGDEGLIELRDWLG